MYMYSGTLFCNGIIETIFMETKQGDQVHCIPNTFNRYVKIFSNPWGNG